MFNHQLTVTENQIIMHSTLCIGVILSIRDKRNSINGVYLAFIGEQNMPLMVN